MLVDFERVSSIKRELVDQSKYGEFDKGYKLSSYG